ncbi:glycoside hydrolase family 130 protein [Tunicatimonas pelagia]|uniref:glycoside hydrolase family 130 protein n=1 Tax=Tunicatimonas pelagia TaxID=931531 RepID=UPI0026667E8A|nr:glycoside hydrolase family 130 protein [Tunicatimonas pelagia]WKN45464.1 glycoside hydrolase family 130 protein [Tunicatimonas pelagia]
MKISQKLLLLTLFTAHLAGAQQKEKDWMLGSFIKADKANPILGKDSTTQFYCPVREQVIRWEAKDVFNPCAVVRNDKVYLLYRAEDYEGKYKGTSRLGLAVSDDGINFKRHGTPVLYPDNDSLKVKEWEGGCEDPRIVEGPNGTYYMTYTAYSGDAIYLALASSRNLLDWEKHGVIADIGQVFPAEGGLKAGMIVSERIGNRLVAKKINGKYWMYWGVGTLRLAISDDLIHWDRAKDEKGNDIVALGPRPDPQYAEVDNLAVEAGPAAVYTDDGIVVFYNGIYNPLPEEDRVPTPAGPNFGNGWCGVQALFDKNDPAKLIDRAEQPSIKPDRPYELRGQIPNVTFVEGLVYFRGRWLAYYGTADSFIAVAIAED